MEVLHARCVGLDVHKDVVVACARIVDKGKVTREVQRFGTVTPELMRLCEWLSELGVTHAVMEATGVYWKPVWHLLEGTCELVLANAQHVKAVPGRKSDLNDAAWLAELLAHGLVRGSFVPPVAQQQLRDLTRTRKQMTRALSQQTQRIQKVLEDANIKLASVASRLLGQAGRNILQALMAGETDARKLAALRGRLAAPEDKLLAALQGRVTEHHRFMLRLHLEQVTAIERGIAELDARIEQQLAPFRDLVERLTAIPGVSHVIARVLLAEVGTDVTHFPSDAHLVSWTGLCPGLDESAGKIRSRRVRFGNGWLKTDLCQAALAASRSKGTYLHHQFHRIRSRRGVRRALIAVAASILTAVYHMLKNGRTYQDLGPLYLDRLHEARTLRRFTKRIEALGYIVSVQKAA
jgi:transposase